MSHFVDDRHNLYVGWVIGLALAHDIPAVPIYDDAGNYTDRIAIPIAGVDKPWVTLVVPPPPDDWSIP